MLVAAAGAEDEVKLESELTLLVVSVVEVTEVLIAFEPTGVLAGVADEEATVQVAFPHISLCYEEGCAN